uniref:Uncharacterized protein n=1 Tax=Panagrolaimus sp. JU765 TaxID=591449 RepID=A0AC34RQQ4_9BILA
MKFTFGVILLAVIVEVCVAAATVIPSKNANSPIKAVTVTEEFTTTPKQKTTPIQTTTASTMKTSTLTMISTTKIEPSTQVFTTTVQPEMIRRCTMEEKTKMKFAFGVILLAVFIDVGVAAATVIPSKNANLPTKAVTVTEEFTTTSKQKTTPIQTTTTPTMKTSTQPIFTTATIEPSTQAFTTLTTVQPEMIRRCTMEEVDGCSMEVYKNSTFCRQNCENELEYFGKNTDKMMTCFETAHEEAEIMHNCLVDKVDGFYTINDTEVVMIPKTNYSNFIHPFNITTDPLNVTTSLKKKARSSFIQFRKFQRCVVNCMKTQIVDCYHRQECDVYLPEAKDVATIFNECRKYKKNIHEAAKKSCYCLLTKKQVTKLAGTCPLIGSPVLMKML